MPNIKFTNFATSQLAVGISAGASSLTVTTGHGSRFPALGAGEYFYATLENASLAREIVKVTARSTDTLTITRAQDNTTALAWNAGDIVALRFNALAIDDIFTENLSKVPRTSTTGSAVLPSGTTAQRDGSPLAGYIRFNTSVTKFEGYTGSVWAAVGGGATGGGSDAVFVENDKTVTTNYTISTNRNAMATGPLTINSGVTVSVPSGSRFVVI